MRRWSLIVLGMLALTACISRTEERAAPTVVVPQGASVVCPSGTPAVYSSGAYRC
jgi:hypothetical protein